VKHVAIVEVLLRHTFYADGRCPDLTIEPSPETARLLRNHRCLVRSSADGVRVLTPLDENGDPFLPLPADAALRFHLTLANPDFPLFTDLAAMSGQKAPVFTNAGVAIEGEGEGDVELRLAPSDEERPRLPQGVFADVEIRLAGLSLGGRPKPATFYVAFQAKKARWVYYCVTDLAPNGSELTIMDASLAGAADVLLFSDANRTKLDEQPDPTDPVAAQIARQYPAMRCVRFISDEAVACREEPRRHLVLRLGGERLAGPLPNPSLRSAAREDLLFRIINVRAHPLQTP
jgi:hypothetical protein